MTQLEAAIAFVEEALGVELARVPPDPDTLELLRELVEYLRERVTTLETKE